MARTSCVCRRVGDFSGFTRWLGIIHMPPMSFRTTILSRAFVTMLTLPMVLALSVGAHAGEPKLLTPSGNPGEWVTTEDYPSAALRNEVEGVVGFRLSVSNEGLPSACEITRSSGSPDLDNQTCTLLMQRARFHAGLDAKGKPVGGDYRSSVRWVIPKTTPAPSAGVLEFSFLVGSDGTPSDCKVLRAEGAAAAMAGHPGPCDNLHDFEPYLDDRGTPVAKRVTMLYSTRVEAP